MANITKIKIDGVEHQIGYGAELEWKLVATGTYDSESSASFSPRYKLDKILEPDKLYYVERYDDNMGATNYSFFKTYQNGSNVMTKCQGKITAYDDNDMPVEAYVRTEHNSKGEMWIDISALVDIYQGEGDTLEVYELVNKNVVNPSNVVEYQEKLVAGENITIEDNVISASGGLYTQYFYIMIKEDDGNEGYYTISMQTSKPITTVEEFRDYIRNSLIYTDGPNYKVTTIYFKEHTNTKPSWLIFDCAYYGSVNCSIYYLNYDGEIEDIITGTNISVVTGRILHFSVLNTVAI